MKKLVWLIVAVLPLALSGCGGSGADSLAKEQVGIMNDMAAALEGVKDDASADAAVAKLKELGAKLRENTKKGEAMKLSEAENKKLEEKYKPEIEKATNRMKSATEQAVKKAPKKAMDLAGALLEVGKK
jgi:hypothetical protein